MIKSNNQQQNCVFGEDLEKEKSFGWKPTHWSSVFDIKQRRRQQENSKFVSQQDVLKQKKWYRK